MTFKVWRVFAGAALLLAAGWGGYGCSSESDAGTGSAGSGAGSGSGGASATNGSSGAGAGSSGSGTSVGSGGCESAPIFETDIVPIFEKSCGTNDDMCHSRVAYGANDSFNCRGWLSLENASIGSQFYAGDQTGQSTGCPDMTLYERLMLAAWQCGAPGNDEPLAPYVAPCDPEGSYLWRKMQQAVDPSNVYVCFDNTKNEFFQPMPPDSQASQADADTVYAWIAAGAPRMGDDPCGSCGSGGSGGSSASGSGGAGMMIGQAPVVAITHPGDNEMRPASSPVPLIGNGTDAEDGTMPGSKLLWSSSIQGYLGNGENLSVNLQVGTHTLSLEAVDSDGNKGLDQITVIMQ
jgi:hypothetical protein